MIPIKFAIFGTPVAKGRPRFARRGKFVQVITPEKTRGYEHSLISQAMQYKPSAPLDIPLRVELVFFFMPSVHSVKAALKANRAIESIPMVKKPDVDNLIKSSLDPLNGIFWVDDARVVEVLAIKRYGMVPRLEYKISEALRVS